MGLADTLEGRPPMHRAAVPAQEDRTAEMASEGSAERCDGDRVPVEGQAQMLPLRRHGQGRQGGESILCVAVGDDWQLSGGSPGATLGRNEQNAALIPADQRGSPALDYV
jgi:hypothetical protein